MRGVRGSGGIYAGIPSDSGLVGPLVPPVLSPAEFPHKYHPSHVLLSYLTLQPLKMDLTEGSETSAIINQTPGNYPKESLLHCFKFFKNNLIPFLWSISLCLIVYMYNLARDTVTLTVGCSLSVLFHYCIASWLLFV